LLVLFSLALAGLCRAQEIAKTAPIKLMPPIFAPPALEQVPLQPVRSVGAAEVYFYEVNEYREKAYTVVRAGTTVYTRKQGQLTLEQLAMFLWCRIRSGETVEDSRIQITFSLYRANAPAPLFSNGDEIKFSVTADGELLGEGTARRETMTNWSLRNSTEAAHAGFDYKQIARMASAKHVVVHLGALNINLGDDELAVFRDLIKAAKK
jgi:hypothetical protein